MKKIIRYFKVWKRTRISAQQAAELSLYPEQPQKRLSQIRRELFYLCRNPKRSSLTLNSTVMDYFNMGIDRAGEDVHRYLFRNEIDKARLANRAKSDLMLVDKWATAKYLQVQGIATTCPIMFKTPFITTEEALDKLRRCGERRFFAKIVDGAFGVGAFTFQLTPEGKFEVDGKIIPDAELMDRLDNYIVEPFIEQHEDMNKLFDGAVSTVRFVTVRQHKSIQYILSNLYVGVKGAEGSNFQGSGIRVGIDENGRLHERGVKTKMGRGIYTSHPDTGVVFKGFQIPCWKEAVELAINAHKTLPLIHSIGWDIAISKTGPLVVEANSRWMPHVFQYYNGPGREYMRQWFDIR